MPGLNEEIADLEAEIERLALAAEQCSKIDAGAKAMTACGGLLLVVLLTGWSRFGPVMFVVGIAAVLAGIALLGSNKRTRDEIDAAIRAHETRRAEMIDALRLLPVGDA